MHNPIIANSLLDPQSASLVVAQATTAFGAWMAAVLAAPWWYAVLLVLAAAAVSVTVYVTLQFATHTAAHVAETIADAHMSGEKLPHALGAALGKRTMVRAVVAIALIMYGQLTITLLQPLCVLLWTNGIGGLDGVLGWAEALFSVVALFAVFHTFTILLRLLFLRPRVFGGKYEVMGALEE